MAGGTFVISISHAGGACALIVLTVLAADLEAQSLGDVARREADRRKAVNAGRVYTNEDLAPASEGAAPAPASVPVDAPAASGSGAVEAPPAAEPAPPGAQEGIVV